MASSGNTLVQNNFLWGALDDNFEKRLRELKEAEKTRRHSGSSRKNRRKKKLAKSPYVRKNRPYVRTSLECCSWSCLYKNGAHKVMRMTRLDFYAKSYEEQNLMLWNLITVETPSCQPDDNGKRTRSRYIYHLIDENASKRKVCRTAFVKTFAISVRRVKSVLSKIMPYTAGLKPDYRGKHHNHLKVSQDMKRRIYDFVIANFKSEESHYCRGRTNKRFLTPTVSKSGMWRKFIYDCRNQDCSDSKYTRSRKNTKHMISRKKFLEIVLNEFDFSFRKLRKDTCDSCDKYKATFSRTRSKKDKDEIQKEHEEHLRDANAKYLKHDYDFLILAKAQSTCDWAVPPEWNAT